MAEQPNPIHSASLSKAGLKHGFFTREGGVSTGIHAGLNVGLGSEDKREHILENRNRVAAYFNQPAYHLTTPYQIHSPNALEVKTPWETDERPKVDALVTSNPDLVIGILTADCGPVLFADQENGIIGAAHAGWKGATSGVLENTIKSMEALGAKRQKITAVLGPTISQSAYEVGPEFVEHVTKLHQKNEKYFIASTRADHAMFDLPGYIVDRLNEADVETAWTGHCTYADEAKFFSYRRKTHRGEDDYGRQIAAISLNR